MRILGIIPARGGSKGIPRKNIKILAGKPLIAHTIDAVKESGICDRLILSTDDAEIADVGGKYGVEVPFMRPMELASDTAATLDVLVHALSWLRETESYVPDVVMLLQPTAPLRKARHIIEALNVFTSTGADSVVSLTEVPDTHNPHWQFTIGVDQRLQIFTGEPFGQLIRRRQDLGKTFTREGSLYIFKTELLFRNPPTFYGDDVRAYVMDVASSLNIDTLEDFALAELRLTGHAQL